MLRLGCLAVLLASPARAVPPLRRVMIVILENTSFQEALRQPFLGELASKGALLRNYRGVTHPSQPNYLALAAGTFEGAQTNQPVDLELRHVGDMLEAKGKAWKAYAEGYPGACFLSPVRGPYARKHVPFLSFLNVQRVPARCARVVDAAELAGDVARGTLPDYSMYIPDNNHNGHDTGAAFADRWLAGAFKPLMEDPAFMRGMLLVVVFDEDDGTDGNRVYAALLGESVRPGAVSDAPYDHYSLLRTIEDGFRLGTLGREDAKAKPIAGVWRDPVKPRLRRPLSSPSPAVPFERAL